MPRIWTTEQRQAQAERCRRIQPWTHSTGPRTKRGKKRSSMNAKKSASFDAWWAAYNIGNYALARLIWRRMNRRSRAGK